MPRPKRLWSSSHKPRRWGDVNANSNTESSLTNSNHGNIGITGSSSDGHSNLSSIPGQSQIDANFDNEYGNHKRNTNNGIFSRPPLTLGLSMSKQQPKSNKSSSATSSGSSSNKNNSSSGYMSSNKKMEFGFDPWATDSPAKDKNNNNNRWDHHTGSSNGNGIEDDTPSPTSVADVPGVITGVPEPYTGTSKIRDYTVSHEDDFFSSRLSKNSAYLNSHLEKNKQRSKNRDRDRYLDRDRDEGVNRDSNGNDTTARWGTTNSNASSGAYNFGMCNVSNRNNKSSGSGNGSGGYEHSSYHRPNDMNYLSSQHTAGTCDNHNLPSLASSSQSQSSTGTNSLEHSHTGSSGTNSHSKTVLGSGSAAMPTSRMEPIYHAPADQQQQQQQHFPPKPQQRPQHLHPPSPPPPPHNGFRNRNSSINHLLNKNNSSNSNAKPHIIPGVSKMTMRQMLSVIFSAYWDRADLYIDVLELEHDNDVDVTTNFNPRQLKLAFFRAGRVALATPIESADDMTMLSAGFRAPSSLAGNGNNGNGNGNNTFISGGSVAGSTVSVVQAGTPVSRKAKLTFQAIALAYELLQDGDKRRMYNEWRMWNSRLPPPRSKNVPVTDRFSPVNPDETISARFRQRDEAKRLASAAQQDKDGFASFGTGMGGYSASRVCETPSILRTSIRCPKGAAGNRMRRSLANISGRRTKAQIQQHQHEQLHLQSIKDRQESVRLSERKITWNEEVEELAIAEEDVPETAASAYSPPRDEHLGYNALNEEGKGGIGSSSGSKENTNPTLFGGMRNFFDDAQKDDPYGPTAEDWPGTVDTDGHGPVPTYQRDLNKAKSNKFATSSLSSSGRDTGSGPLPGPIRFEQASTVESYIERNNFQSLGSRTEQLSSGDPIYDETNPNDSLMIILDGPYDSSETEGHGPGHIAAQSHAVQKPDCSWTADDQEETDDDLCWDGFVDPVPDGGGDTDVTDDEIIAITSHARHKQQQELIATSASASGTAPILHDADASGVIPHLPPNPVPEIIVDDVGSVSTNEFSASWASDQYEGGAGDCDLGHTVDLARGFQASLSNYINAAVMDMKEGLQIVGETLEENVAGAGGNKSGSDGSNGNGNGGERKNFFLLDTTELDAMMSILKKEMDGLAEAPVFGSSRDKGDSNGYNYGRGDDNVTSTSDDIPQGIGYPPQSGFNMKQNKSILGAGNGNASVSNISMGSSAPLTGGRKTQRFGTKRFFGNLFSRG